MLRIVLLLLCSSIYLSCSAQYFHGGGLLELAGSAQVKDRWSSTAKLATLHRTFEGLPNTTFSYQHIQSDLQLFAGYQLQPRWEVALGYHILVIPSGIAHRAIQQLAFVQKGRRSKTGHRFRFDQTYQNGNVPAYRIRYRFSWEKPLSGFSLDPGEYYFLFSTEPMPRYLEGAVDAEHRLGLSVGKKLIAAGKIELGLDYRTRNIFTQLNHRCLIRFGSYFKF